MNRQNSQTINSRIKEVRRHFFNGSNIRFAGLMGQNQNTTSNWVRDGYNVGRGVAGKIAEKLPVNLNWLLMGAGEMLIQQGEQNINISGDSNSNIGNRNTSNYGAGGGEKQKNMEGIPLIPFDCIAGYGEDNSGIKLNNCDRYIIPDLESAGAEFLVRVSGSSMYPKYSSGDILACKKVHDILFFQWGKIYVIDSSQGQLVKRIFQDENENMIQLVSDNKEKYPPFSIPKSDIRSLSIVLGVVRME